jgi:hypothetical protein
MEEDPLVIHSPLFEEVKFKKQLERIAAAAETAQGVIDYTTAHDEEILRAIDVVETFLRKKHRLCYGGQAINAHLPKRHKIYDPQYSIPDYDFFTPQQDNDIRYLSKMLRKAGFNEISAREGMHEGTIKIYVNYIPVADITSLDPKLYQLLSAREYRSEGISYMDANTLRMLMYLELSRPRGEVERWSKVYERLMLLNKYVPVDSRECKREVKTSVLNSNEINAIMHYCIKEKRIFAGADLAGFYEAAFTGKKKAKWLMYTKRPIYMYTQDLERDVTHFRYELHHLEKSIEGRENKDSTELRIHRIKPMGGDLVPEMVVFTRNKYPVFILVSQTACHSYYNIPLKYGNNLRIATLDTLITLYFSMALLKYRFMDLGSLECLAQELVEVSYRARDSPEKFPFQFISLECSGHQSRLASLIREKVKRFDTRRKKKLQALIRDEAHPRSVTRNQKWEGMFFEK